jgi:hypothetical protein
MDLTPHHAKYFANDLTRRAVTGTDRLSMSLFDAAVDLNQVTEYISFVLKLVGDRGRFGAGPSAQMPRLWGE